MAAVVIVGAQWGDEGKGKVVDLYTENAELVVRYAGGPNAGHTLVVGDDKLVVRLLPSGILREGTRCVLGQGMVVDLDVLVGEIDELVRRGQSGLERRLFVSDRAHLILPYHVMIDELREGAASKDRAIGTTKKGIGPAYEDKARRTGVRAGELREPAKLRARIEAALEAWAPTIAALGGEQPAVDGILERLAGPARRIVPLLTDASRLVDEALRQGARALFEGAQGTLLDIDHGTYPFVTSSSAVAGGAGTGVGIGPTRIDAVIGITKAYTTRVGSGPFPTELHDAAGQHLRDVGVEFGSVTKRPRRTGWLDVPALRYAARVNGLDGLALTKLDVLTGLERVKVCVAYDTPSGRTLEFPIDRLDEPGVITPVYEELEGWSEPVVGARTLGELPRNARAYVRFIEARTEVRAVLVSVGPRRSETILLADPFTRRATSEPVG
ncbi:MAG: adenylosuccinate synthase [Sorangiineae bacterium]|nr:adenylosuccinate synthase [Polyangiaceae bacterium]MEB2325018.1 adenylosuccinate synthase [Sorangiineae bacterium]